MNTIANNFIKDIDRLIPRPDIALDVMSLANQSECDIAGLCRKINQDPSLMANMLRLANSAYFGHMKEISSIRDIIVRLGLDSVRMIAITSASAGILKTPQEAYNLEPGALWRHSHATALLAVLIGRHAKIDGLSSLYSAGLLHDVGKIILNRHLQVESMNRGGINDYPTMLALEKALLHTDHAKVGIALLHKWGLPEAIIDPVGSHHNLSACQYHLPRQIIYLANHLAESIGIPSGDAENSIYLVKESYETAADGLPEIPGFTENMETIINLFYEQFTGASTLEFT
ncbi:MAG: HDOD domain-containing protein [Proteobacteria bacterium]|nr:HDOD domain-containing protein [Desulfobulbaceae bacterium]MBU4152021.1 HDOD domain-containing protein [Pseudomonadota bacterium]MDP2104705.1 HDOD domain-containing protein [Desulfobulbaceae bacterium]